MREIIVIPTPRSVEMDFGALSGKTQTQILLDYKKLARVAMTIHPSLFTIL